jgi:hypothetical protein
MKNILFYNLWHNGDVFSGRGYLQHIKNSLPNVKFGYYHVCNSKIVSDLIRTQFKPDLKKFQVEQLNYNKIFETNETIYINSWVGAYFYQNQSHMTDHSAFIANLEGEGHANYLSLHKIYKFIIDYLNSNHGCDIILENNPLTYVPTINWEKYEIQKALDFIKQHDRKRHLICNGKVRSMQSGLSNLSQIIDHMAMEFKNDVFICTEKFETNQKNIFFTSEIFNIENDLNEISYLSTFCDTIVGKNSGPFMFTHVKENINNLNKIFVAMSHNVSDCYPYHMKNLPCKYLFTSNESPSHVANAIENAISLSHGSIINLSRYE